MEKVKFFDTTLRDGEQSPGCSMLATEKLTLAKQLERLGVNTIEAGFAASSPGDFESVRDIGQQIEKSTVVSLCRASKNDIDSAIEAFRDAKMTAKNTISIVYFDLCEIPTSIKTIKEFIL